MKFTVGPEDALGIAEIESASVPKPVRTLAQLEEIVQGNELLEELLESVFNYSVKYAITVAKYNQILHRCADEGGVMDKELEAMEPERTAVHNATVDTINAFSRQLGKLEKDNSWVADFGHNRAVYGKFALLLACDWLRNNRQ